MLIDRQRLIESIQSSPSRDRFDHLLSVLQKHQFQDLLLTNVLLEAQTFEVLPFALHSALKEDQLSPADERQAILSWMILSQTEEEHLFDPLLASPNETSQIASEAAGLVDRMIDKECGALTETNRGLASISQFIIRKLTFYRFCKKLDSALSTATAHSYM